MFKVYFNENDNETDVTIIKSMCCFQILVIILILGTSPEIYTGERVSFDKLFRSATISPLIETITPEEGEGPIVNTHQLENDSLGKDSDLIGNENL